MSSTRTGKWRKGPRRWLFPALIALSIAGVVGLLALTVLSFRVTGRFEARERESPTRIYSRAIPLRPGEPIPGRVLADRLDRLGYTRTRGEPASPGQYSQGRGSLTVHLRAFPVPGGEEPARLVRIYHRDGRISSVFDPGTGRHVAASLEPEVLATLYGPVQEDRTVLALPEFPQRLIDAVLATEDRHFYAHPGIDPFGTARAAVENMESGSIVQGGSTITQQLAKNLYLGQERTFTRKVSEALVALILEWHYSKDRILQAYLNEVYLGQMRGVSIKGFAQAASFYFGKDLRQLDLPEIATLAGLIPAPGRFNPFLHPDSAVERRNLVLAAMEKTGAITPDERKKAERARLAVDGSRHTEAPTGGVRYLADYVRQTLGDEASRDLSREGVRIFTTIDPLLQHDAEAALSAGLDDLERRFGWLRRKAEAEKLQAALVVLDPRDGSVRAIVGGRDYARSQFNRVTQARRQPGSAFKPFVYLAGYQQTVLRGWDADPFTPATRLLDEPLEMTVAGKLWSPANYDNLFRGPVTAQMALEESLNVPTVRAAQSIGLEEIVAIASAAGIDTAIKPYPSLALGAQEVTPLEIAAAYATIANGGTRNDPSMVEAVEDPHGSLSFRRTRDPRRAFSPEAAFQVTVALQGALDHGTGKMVRSLGYTGTAAGKTGTTDDFRDAWFVGYTPDILALVWVGFDDGESTRLPGSQAALPIWVDFMTRGRQETHDPFTEPEGIEWSQVDPESGGLRRWSCDEGRWMAFIEGTQPRDKCELHGWFGRGRQARSGIE